MKLFTLQQQFTETAKKHPTAIALRSYENTLSYKDLNEITNQLANCLREYGIKAEDRVAIYLPRNFELFIAIIAVLKTGACYVPIATNYPAERRQYILTDSAAKILISNTKSIHINTATFIFDINEFMRERNNYEKKLPHIHYRPTNAAYIIYTSGSTGNPKGVLIEQAGICNFIEYSAIQWNIKLKTKVLQFANICFDRSIQEWATTLLYGGELNIVPQEHLPPYRDLGELINALKINILAITPSILSTMDINMHYPYLEIISCGGEALTQSLVDQWAGKVKLLNEYGPSETSIIVTLEQCFATQPVTIGKTIPNVQAYVVNELMQPLEPNQTGELLIGGICLAREYINQAEMTQKSFIKNPFSSHNDRLYKTGDYVQLLADGRFKYLGRKDDQVKIRGFRVELEEITHTMMSYPKITLAATKIFTHHDQQLLVGYYSTVDKKAIAEKKLHAFLAKKLADYMLPNHYIFIENMPLTTSDKINKKLLPDPIIKTTDKKLPHTKLEIELAELWAKILDIPLTSINLDVDFFSLGGNSLTLVKLIQDIKKMHLIHIPVAAFLETPTIESLQRLIITKEVKKHSEDALIPEKIKNDLVLSENISFEPYNSLSKKPHQVLITGVSGFLGCYLLKEWLQHTDATLYCIVRAASVEHGKQRIKANLKKYHLDRYYDEKRIIVLIGDLTKPLLDLSLEQWTTLENIIDTIIHNGALVHHLYSYLQLRTANVASTLELIKLAAKGKPKIFHYISSVSAVADLAQIEMELEPLSINKLMTIFSGYGLSKKVSEQLLWQAKQRGLSCRIYRPGNIMGDAQLGFFNYENNHFWSLIKSCKQLKAAPNWQKYVEITPVNTVAKAIFKLANTIETNQGIYNLNNPFMISFKEFLKLLKQLGVSLPIISSTKWLEKIQHVDDTNALFPLKLLYTQAGINAVDLDFPQYTIPTGQTQTTLKQLNIQYPTDYFQLMKTYLNTNQL